MLFEDGGNVVVQKSSLGGYMTIVPSEKLDLLTSELDSAEIDYEMEENFVNVDDMNQDLSTASVLMFGPHANIGKIQSILDHLD